MHTFYFSPTKGFASDLTHGPREIAEPQSERDLKAGKRPKMVPNPETNIPEDAVKIDRALHAELMQAQSDGKAIVIRGGLPVAIDPKSDPEAMLAARRGERDRRLAASDWTQLPDAPLTEAERAAWASYRQALRDLDLTGTGWPEAPSAEQD